MKSFYAWLTQNLVNQIRKQHFLFFIALFFIFSVSAQDKFYQKHKKNIHQSPDPADIRKKDMDNEIANKKGNNLTADQIKEAIKKDPSKREEILEQYGLRFASEKASPVVLDAKVAATSKPELSQQTATQKKPSRHSAPAGKSVSSLPSATSEAISILASESDSTILVAIYNATNGHDWYYSDGWLKAPLEEWYGVQLSPEGRVISLELDYSNLTGVLPDLSGLSALQYLTLSHNSLSGGFPAEIAQLTALQHLDLQYNRLEGVVPDLSSLLSLQYLRINNNSFNGIPVLTSLSSLLEVSVYENNLTFEDILPNASLNAAYYYSPQEAVVDTYEIINGAVDYTWTLDFDPSVTGSYYEFYKDDMYFTGDTDMRTINVNARGNYVCYISNEILPDLTLTANLNIQVSANETDSLTLVELYNSMKGESWYVRDNWLTGPVSSWYGVTTDDSTGNVVDLNLGYNNLDGNLIDLSTLTSLETLYLDGNSLDGSIPSSLSSLSNLVQLSLGANEFSGMVPDLSALVNLEFLHLNSNQLEGTFPSWLGQLEKLVSINFSENELSGSIPDLSGFSNLGSIYLDGNRFTSLPALISNDILYYVSVSENWLDQLPDLSGASGIFIDLSDNRLDFADIEPYAGFETFSFYSQQDVTEGGLVSLNAGQTFSTTLEVGGLANNYQWYSEAGILADQTSATLSVVVEETNTYFCEISSSVVPDVVLNSGEYTVFVPKDTTIQKPAVFFNYENQYYLGEEYYYEMGLGVSDLNGANFNIWTDVVSADFNDIDPVGEKIYFSTEFGDEDDAIMSMSLNDGHVAIVLKKQFDELEDVAVDYLNGHIYYTDGCCSGGVSFVKRVNFDGTGDSVIVSGLDDPIELEIDLLNGKLYWSDFKEDESDEEYAVIQRSNLDGSEIETLFEQTMYDGGLEVDPLNGVIFWTIEANDELDIKKLMKADLSGQNAAEIPITNYSIAFAPIKNEKKIIYAAFNDTTGYANAIYKANYDGSGATFLSTVPAVQYIFGIFVYEDLSLSAEPVNTTDSLALVKLYQSTAGASWTSKAGWLTDNVGSWHGITVAGGRVTGINLNGNNLTGNLPVELANLTALETLNVSANSLTGSIPAFITTMTSIKSLNLAGNEFKGEIPAAMNGMTSLTSLNLSNNAFIGNVPPQLGAMDKLEMLNLSKNELEGSIPATFAQLVNLKVLNISDNAFFAELTPELGSLALLTDFNAENNMFFGAIPSAFTGMESIRAIDISGNDLEGSLSVFASLGTLSLLDASNNKFTELPDLTQRVLSMVDARKNYLDFGDFELNSSLIGQEILKVFPQDSLYDELDTLHNIGQNISLSFPQLKGSNNTYQWYFNKSKLDSKTTATLLIESPESPNEGQYVLEVRSQLFPNQVLYTSPINLKLTSLERDRQALLALYNATKGESWKVKTNWNTANALNTWSGVTVEGDRVVGLNLADNNLQGDVPRQFMDLNGLKVLDLSGNFITAFPDISKFKLLTGADISDNRLAFKDIIPNISLGANILDYAPQKRYGNRFTDTLQAGQDIVVSTSFNFPGTEYQWSFGPLIPGKEFNNDVTEIAGATSRTYLVENLDYDKQGTYRVAMTHPLVEGLTIESFNRNIWASTDVFGTVFTAAQTPLSSGQVIMYRITDGPYVPEDTIMVSTDGKYEFNDVVLGDFVVLVRPPRPTNPQPGDVVPVQTYYIKTENYGEATTLEVRERIEGVDIEVVTYEIPTLDPIGATISGLIESDFEEVDPVDEEGQRVQARRKVKKAGCSMRRRTRGGGGRGLQDEEWELFAYVESNDEGVFDFTGIPEGTYLLNIEYPGIPITETSDIEFEIGGDVQEQKFEAVALITEAGIDIDAYEVLSVEKPYLKDVVLYPNPTEDVMVIDFVVNRRIDDLKMAVTTIKGERLFEEKLNSQLGKQRVKLNMKDVSPGMYFLIFTDEAGTFRQQVKIGRK